MSSDEDTIEIAGWSISYLDLENGVAFLWKDEKRICWARSRLLGLITAGRLANQQSRVG